MEALQEWYAINTFIGKEKTVKQLIESMGFDDVEVCNLSRFVSEKKNNVIRTRIKTIFTGYIFIKGNLDAMKFIRIKALSDVIGFVSEGMMPVSVAETSITKLLDMAMEYPLNAIPESKVAIDENGIEIIDGPLMGYEKMIFKTSLRHRRIYLNLSLFGNRYTVSMPAMMAAN